MKVYELTYQKNIRDLGGLLTVDGKHIKSGRLFRGGALNKVTDEDVKVVDSFHLTDIVDFRSSDEFCTRPDYRFKGVTYHNFTTFEHEGKKEDKKYEDGNLLWFIDEGNDGFKHLQKTYKDLVISDEGIKAYQDFFKVLLEEENRVTYFHCSQGKDRAGLAAFYLEMALGVSLEDTKEDYLLSNVAMEKRVDILLNSVKDKSFYNKDYHQSLLDVFSAKIEYLDEAIKCMIEMSGSVIKYIENVLKVDIKKLKEIYLEG